MLQAFVITLREGLEAFLIVAISLAYLRKTNRRALIPALHWGIVASIALSVAADLLRTFEREAEPERETEPEVELEPEGSGARS